MSEPTHWAFPRELQPKAGEVVPRVSAQDPVFVFEPIRVQCSATGVTTWSKDPASTNRFLLRVKNQSFGLAWRFAFPGLRRDALVVGYVLLREWGSIGGLARTSGPSSR